MSILSIQSARTAANLALQHIVFSKNTSLLISTTKPQARLCEYLFDLKAPISSLHNVESTTFSSLSMQLFMQNNSNDALNISEYFYTFFQSEPISTLKPPLAPNKNINSIERTILALYDADISESSVETWSKLLSSKESDGATELSLLYARFRSWLRAQGIEKKIEKQTLDYKNLIVSDAHNLKLGDLKLLLFTSPPTSNTQNVTFVIDPMLELNGTGSPKVITTLLEDIQSSSRNKNAWNIKYVDELQDTNESIRLAITNLMEKKKKNETRESTQDNFITTQVYPSSIKNHNMNYFNYVQRLKSPQDKVTGGGVYAIGVIDTIDSMDSLTKFISNENDTFFPDSILQSLSSLVKTSNSIGVICRSSSQAVNYAEKLRASLSCSDWKIVLNITVKLGSFVEVRLLLAVLSLLTGSGSRLEALYLLLTSSRYSFPPDLFVNLLESSDIEISRGKNFLKSSTSTVFTNSIYDPAIFGALYPFHHPNDLRTLSIDQLLIKAISIGGKPSVGAKTLLMDLTRCRSELVRTGSVLAAAAEYCKVVGWDNPETFNMKKNQKYEGNEIQAALSRTLDILRTCEQDKSIVDDTNSYIPSFGRSPPFFLQGAVHTSHIACTRILSDDATVLVGGENGELEDKLLSPVIHGKEHQEDTKLIVITTIARSYRHYFDILVLPNFTEASLPGRFTRPLLPTPPLFHLDLSIVHESGNEEFKSISLVNQEISLSPFPSNKEENIDFSRQRLKVLFSRARRAILLLDPPTNNKKILSSERRSRFSDELFGEIKQSDCLKSINMENIDVTSSSNKSTQSFVPLTPTVDPLHFFNKMSISRISEYLWCPQRYYLSRIASIPGTSSLSLLHGKALHAAFANAGELFLAALHDIPILTEDMSLSDSNNFASTAIFSPEIMKNISFIMNVVFRIASGDKETITLLKERIPKTDELIASMLAIYRQSWTSSNDQNPFAATGSNLELIPTTLTACSNESYFALEKSAVEIIESFVQEELDIFLQSLSNASLGSGSIHFPMLVETPFTFSFSPFQFNGVIDRVDILMNISNKSFSFLVREFKSGSTWKKGLKSSATSVSFAQVELYMSALQEALLSFPKCKTIDIQGQVESIEERTIVNIERKNNSKDEVSPLETIMFQAAHGILQQKYTATPSSFKCTYCNVRDACQYASYQ